MQKIFVSMPMRDLFEDEIRSRQETLLKKVGEYLGKPVMLVETFINDGKLTALECLGELIKRMAGADWVLFASGWETARGCKIEMACALQYNKKILLENGSIIQEVN
ncbi:MAG: hypothetical protein IJS28_07350 [Synergistaceae bacterium]|nr:hypothetical protein [Synergistaceae bacterium]